MYNNDKDKLDTFYENLKVHLNKLDKASYLILGSNKVNTIEFIKMMKCKIKEMEKSTTKSINKVLKVDDIYDDY